MSQTTLPSERKTPEFTTDWFSGNIKNWTALLGHLVGIPALGVEVGSYEGRSACWLMENIFTHRQSHLTCIDIWRSPEIEDRFNRNIDVYGKRVRKFKGDSPYYLTLMQPRSLDFVYIDGSHEGRDALTDGLLGLKALRPGGIMIFDDYKWPNPDGRRHHTPKPAIDAFLKLCDFEVETILTSYQVAIRKKG